MLFVVPVQEIDKEASAVFLDVQTDTRHQSMRDQEVVLDEVLGDPKDVVKSAKANLKKPATREVHCTNSVLVCILTMFLQNMRTSFSFSLCRNVLCGY
jgi:hypothetical protein